MTSALRTSDTNLPGVELRKAFGQVVASDFPLPRLPLADRRERESVTIVGSLRFCGADVPAADAPERFRRESSRGGVRYLAGGIGEFLIEERGRRITYSLAKGAAPEDVQHVLTGPALVMALQLQGTFVLHAASIEVGGHIVALAAPHGFGKSTLAGHFMNAGFSVHGDDVVPLWKTASRVVAGEGQPWLKLWEQSLDALGRNPKDFDEVMRGFGKRVVPRFGAGLGELPLAAVYVLAPHVIKRPICIQRLGLTDATFRLIGNVYSPELMVGQRAASALEFATYVAESVPVSTVSYHRSFEQLPILADAIIQDALGEINVGE